MKSERRKFGIVLIFAFAVLFAALAFGFGIASTATIRDVASQPKTDVFVDRPERLTTHDTHINRDNVYNFSIRWEPGVWDVMNLDNVTYTVTTSMNLTYVGNWELYQSGTENFVIFPFTHIGQNYTWMLPLEDRFASTIILDPHETIQDTPWADMVVDATEEDNHTRVNITFVPAIASVSVNLIIHGKIIDVSAYPSEFEVEEFFPNFINFYGDRDELNQNQTYNFSIIVDNPGNIDLWFDKTPGWATEYSNTLTLPVNELGSVTVISDVPVEWGYGPTQPIYAQGITIEFEEIKGFDTREGTYPSIFGIHKGTIRSSHDVVANKMYTYPCTGTGGHSEWVAFYNSSTEEEIANETWKGYMGGDCHYITFDKPFTLKANVTYNYTIKTGSYPQIHHNRTLTVPDGEITCTEFIDANGKRYDDWIPAIRLE